MHEPRSKAAKKGPKKAVTRTVPKKAAPKKRAVRKPAPKKAALCKTLNGASAAEFVETLSEAELCKVFTKSGMKMLQESLKPVSKGENALEIIEEFKDYATNLTGQHLKLTPNAIDIIKKNNFGIYPRSDYWFDLRDAESFDDIQNIKLNTNFGEFQKLSTKADLITSKKLADFKKKVKTLKQLDAYLAKK